MRRQSEAGSLARLRRSRTESFLDADGRDGECLAAPAHQTMEVSVPVRLMKVPSASMM